MSVIFTTLPAARATAAPGVGLYRIKLILAMPVITYFVCSGPHTLALKTHEKQSGGNTYQLLSCPMEFPRYNS